MTANEPVEKVPTTEKVPELGVPKWSLNPRSLLKRQIRRLLFLSIFRFSFSYRLNAAVSGRGERMRASGPLYCEVRRHISSCDQQLHSLDSAGRKRRLRCRTRQEVDECFTRLW